jgi:hypothetical protein
MNGRFAPEETFSSSHCLCGELSFLSVPSVLSVVNLPFRFDTADRFP